ncbi:MAG: OadG family transporter subunit [Bacteroidales bacterium]|jgi:Na+-transporting methylmalonyl-CoA/oxaloacetate decarboxylase gamma subunit|nr:OadG family transporter subunit [Bacteroidales bacterium]MDD2824618.1 OadG family transporter subunit [Bacteroidales bacterium]MDD3100289.1 OadG family transporter subunit [Bacteroidales bacterium]MDD3639101.1 OadG family transporter subunit [Bacteroidales bacterium]MDD3943660.1 OadG family transporter subunit [Bacteroidales bacterium]
MKKHYKFILAGFIMLFHVSLWGQSMIDLRLNELLITNTQDYQDDFGMHSSWFEIFNTGYGTVDIGGCYLSNDPADLKKYTIPRGDILTKIKPRQHLLFWADSKPHRGSFHVNFTLENSEVLILTSSDGSTILDMVRLPSELEPNRSFGRLVDGEGSYGPGSDNTGWAVLSRTSPSTNNHSLDGKSRSEMMKETDPFGWIMAAMAMSVVFLSLVLLYLVFKGTGNIALRWSQKKADAYHKAQAVPLAETSGETFAAIAAALHLYANENEVHDVESTILTIEQVRRNYSPWNSKIQSLRRSPDMKKK